MKIIHFKNKFSQLYLLYVLGMDNMNERKISILNIFNDSNYLNTHYKKSNNYPVCIQMKRLSWSSSKAVKKFIKTSPKKGNIFVHSKHL